ncbi:MAG: hypothetical protein L7V86_11890, partial [Verrucomicrobiales bacterium]|nr:hypothetical protein [Verrucomicrobiales bacterium]
MKRDLFLVRWWLVALAILLLGDVAVRFVEGLRPASDFWWEMLGHVDVWTVRLALGIWFGLVVFLFQEDRMDGKPAFWQARPTSVLRLVWGKVISVGLLLSAFWILLSVIDGSWSFRWTCGPMALAGVAAVVSVLSPGWRRLAIGLAGVGSLVWLGGVAWPWLLRFLGPGSAHGERAFFEMWLLAGLGAWGTLVVYVTMKRPMLAWAALVMSLGGAWFALASLRPGEATMGEDFGDEELTGEIELLFDPSARGDVERKLSGGVFVVDISRRAELVGVPLGVSVRARLEDAALSTDGGLRFSGNASFLKTLDRTPELFTNYRFSKAEPKDDEPDLLISGEGADMLPFINQLCDYRAEAVVELWKPENVHSFPFGSAGAWRDDEVA